MYNNNQLQASIFDIQSYCIHDGPGCRTNIFFKGCFLNCDWCCNPEGIDNKPSILYKKARCRHCNKCLKACENGAISINNSQGIIIDRQKCTYCIPRRCIQVCSNEAIVLCGKLYSVDDLLKIIERDRQFWGPDGGITLSGGEPFFQNDFIESFILQCLDRYIHIAMETSAYIDWETFYKIVKLVNWIFIDIKHFDKEKHIRYTGVSNELILENIKKLSISNYSGKVIIRIPLIPEINSDLENIFQIAEFMSNSGLDEVNILPFHNLATSKYEQLGINYKCNHLSEKSIDSYIKISEIFADRKIKVYFSHDTPF